MDTGIDHVVLCVADQWRGDALGQLGTPGVLTPHLDRLADDAVTFANHHCVASPCGPARRSLHTGTLATTHGQFTNDGEQGADLETLAGRLAGEGITPLLIGYTDTPTRDHDPDDWETLIDPAFEVVQPFVWQHGFPRWKQALRDAGHGDGGKHPFGPYAPAGSPDSGGLAPAHYPSELSDVRFLTDAAIATLERLPERSLLHVNWLRPHPPMTAPAPWHRLIDPESVELPARQPLAAQIEQHPYFAATVPNRSMTEYTQLRRRIEEVDEQTERHVRAAYYGLCAEVDDAVGRLIDELQARGLWDRTLFVFTSDHGEALGDHWIWGRRGPFDGHLRVPCLVRDPRQVARSTRGTRVDAPTAAHDLLATICAAVGVEPPATSEGESLLPFVHGERPTWRDHLTFAMSWADHAHAANLDPDDAVLQVVRTDRHRLVRFPTLPPLLFDRDEDPLESVDLGTDPARRRIIDELDALAPAFPDP